MSRSNKRLARRLNEELASERSHARFKPRRNLEHMQHRLDSTGTGAHRDRKRYTRKRKHKHRDEF